MHDERAMSATEPALRDQTWGRRPSSDPPMGACSARSSAWQRALPPGSSPAVSATATKTPSADFAKVVPVEGHGVYVRCVGHGSPIVVLIAGAGVFSVSWDYVGDPTNTVDPPTKSPKALEPQLTKVAHVCAYDRPGTTGFDGSPSR